ncbi:pectinacetylesterase family protein [Hyalangium gracile]|uniref:pectinacetylesterase family protein n=1 Tax=Hyalangium gracile TaxID=394092 RepID=UPI001CC98B31|nr:pectinacetylesterase family protein [Hyalangium gracile]
MGPISAPENQWTWVPFPETRCGNGTPAGIGLNPAPGGSRRVFVYMAGGGACWDFITCYQLRTSAHVEDTYTQALLDSEVAGLSAAKVTERQDAANPFRDAHFVYIPYCTGDLHGGDAIRGYDSTRPDRKMHHVGASNVAAFLEHLKATFPDTEQIWLTGTSAGGYGAQLNFDQFSLAFPNARVDLLADSAQVVMPSAERWQAMFTAWKPRFPEGCTDCAQRLPALIDTLATRWPDRRLGLLAYDNDGVLSSYFNYSAGQMVSATNALLANQYSRPNTRSFVVTGNSHGMLDDYKTLMGPGGVSLESWIRQWAVGDPGWSNVR